MLLSLKINNCMIYNSEVEFSMRANMHYKRFPNNVANHNNINVLKTAVIIGPNNSGKTNLVRIIGCVRDIMLGKGAVLINNLFSNNPIAEISVSFLENGEEYLFEIKYNTLKKEYVYECFALIEHDEYKNTKVTNILLRDYINTNFFFSG